MGSVGSLPRWFPLFSFFCLLVSSVCDSCPGTKRAVVDNFFFFSFLGSLVQLRCGEGEMLQTNNTGVCSQCLSHSGSAPTHGAHRSGSRLLCPEPSEAGPGLHAPPRSKRLRLRHSGSPQRHRLGWACVCALPRSEQLGCLASAVAATYRLSRLCCSAFWVYSWRTFSGG